MNTARLILVLLAALTVAGLAEAIVIKTLTTLVAWWKNRRTNRGAQ